MAVLVGPMALEVFRALARSFMCVESYCFVCVSFMAHKKKILGMKTKLSFSFEELFTLWFHVFILLMHLSHFPEPSSLIPCLLPCGGGVTLFSTSVPSPTCFGPWLSMGRRSSTAARTTTCWRLFSLVCILDSLQNCGGWRCMTWQLDRDSIPLIDMSITVPLLCSFDHFSPVVYVTWKASIFLC